MSILAGLQARQYLKDLKLRDLERLIQQAQTFAPDQPPGTDLQLKYLQGMGAPWPKMQRPETAGMDIDPSGQFGGRAVNLPEQTLATPGEIYESVEDMNIRQAMTGGRIQGTIAGEKAVTQGGYQPQIIEQQGTNYDLYNEMLKSFGEDPGKWGVMEGVTGLQRYQEEPAEEIDEWGSLLTDKKSGLQYQVNKKTGEIKSFGRPSTGGGKSEGDKIYESAERIFLNYMRQLQPTDPLYQYFYNKMNLDISDMPQVEKGTRRALSDPTLDAQTKYIIQWAHRTLMERAKNSGLGAMPDQSQDPLGILK